MNLGTAVVALGLTVIVGAIIAYLLRSKRQGKHVGCDGCGKCGNPSDSACCGAADDMVRRMEQEAHRSTCASH